ncbi:MAG: TatD family hydrolase, partial [Gemmatimonadaceae bacterium]|nr:TatD family hydrolase [Gemmatimonadaceae bacterium]
VGAGDDEPVAARTAPGAGVMRFVDSHSHLADAAFDADRDAVIERAIAAGAALVVCIGASLEDAARARELAARYPLLRWTAGLHPQDAASFDAEALLPALEALLDTGAVAVGECGLDYHYESAPRAKQHESFSAQLSLAAARSLPVIVHTREAEADTAMMIDLAARDGVVGVLHCYTGSLALAERALGYGWYVSFSGIITFRNWTNLDLLRAIPDDRVLVESDAPYLAPVPRRGKRNEPALVVHTIEKLAEVRGVSPESLAERTGENARRLFGVAPQAPNT